MSSGLKKTWDNNNSVPACPTESQRKDRGSNKPYPGEAAPSRLVFCKKKRGNPTDCP